jgi:hypothetical protein
VFAHACKVLVRDLSFAAQEQHLHWFDSEFLKYPLDPNHLTMVFQQFEASSAFV